LYQRKLGTKQAMR